MSNIKRKKNRLLILDFFKTYLERHSFKTFSSQKPHQGLLQYIVVIPAYCEPDIFNTLISLKNCKLPNTGVEVIIITNNGVDESPSVKDENKANHKDLEFWCKENSYSKLLFSPYLANDLPQKHAGAGLSRKIGMDTAIQHFIEADNPNGIIISLDADTIIHPDYFLEIDKAFTSGNQPGGCILNFSHIQAGNASKQELEASRLYEIHLRYYKHALCWSGFPYTNYTIGSCFAVKAGIYCKYGGMNRRKAGEDFYFLHKIFPNEYFKFIRKVLVYPSPRISKRVPFGTGPAIEKIISEQNYKTYHPQCFRNLKTFLDAFCQLAIDANAKDIFLKKELTEDIRNFLNNNNYAEHFNEIKHNSASLNAFQKRFFSWFNGLMVIQYFNYASLDYFPKMDVVKSVVSLFNINLDKSRAQEEHIHNYLLDLDRRA